MKRETSDFIKGLVIGSTVGAAAGILLAPTEGSELRARIFGSTTSVGEQASEVSAGVGQKLGQARSQSRRYLSTLRERIALSIEAGKEAAEEKRAELESEVASVTQPIT